MNSLKYEISNVNDDLKKKKTKQKFGKNILSFFKTPETLLVTDFAFMQVDLNFFAKFDFLFW